MRQRFRSVEVEDGFGWEGEIEGRDDMREKKRQKKVRNEREREKYDLDNEGNIFFLLGTDDASLRFERVRSQVRFRNPMRTWMKERNELRYTGFECLCMPE